MSHDDTHPHAGDHHHEHDHPHTPIEHDAPVSHYEALETTVRELLIEQGVITADQVRVEVELMDSRDPTVGNAIVARAWSDPAFKQRLLASGRKAAAEMGVEVGAAELVVVENTPGVHNLVVCTLCSCYPRMVLGRPPDWYKSRPYRSRAVREPRAVLREFGTEVPDDVEVRVHDSTADMRYLVLPQRPAGTEGWPEERLRALISRDSMIGVARAKQP
jgi:nitrile hydratase subunit alpha